jgi:DUF4097 and DUF4098 domain-containing protein YvlB
MGIPPSIPPQGPPPYPPSRAQWKAQRAQWRMQAKMQRAPYRAQYRGFSRSSLLGPIFIIAIGIFALLMTMHRINIAYFWQCYGHWWPLVLIGAGVLLALESLAFSRYSRIRVGGGAVLLLLLLAILGIAASHNHVNWTAVGDQLDLGDNVDLSQMFGTKHESSEQITQSVPANATLVIQNPHGNVTIASSNETTGDGQMHLALEKTIYSNSDSESQRKMQSMEPLITSNGSVMIVHMPSSDSQTADMDITLPANVALEIHAGHGDVTINGRQAPAAINADHGDVQLAGITGTVHATMHQGDFSASNIQGDLNLSGHMDDVTLSQITGVAALDGDFFGDVHLENLHGPVHVHSSRTDIQLAQLAGSVTLDGDDLTVDNAAGPVTVATEAKNIALHRVTGELHVHNSNGDVEVKTLNPIGAMNIENRNGSVQVTLPADVKFSVEATAADGEVHTDFNHSAQNGNDHSIVSGSVSGGGPLIHITAEKGDITLHKDSR